MNGLQRLRNRGSATSDFIVFFTISTLFFVIGGLTLVPWVHGIEPLWLLQRWDASSDLASRLFGAELLSPARGRTREDAVSAMPRSETYRVRPGDTLSEIAQTHAVAMSELVSLNGIEEPDILRVGQVLLIRETRVATANVAKRDFAAVDELVAMAKGQLRGARFEDALETAGKAIRLLESDADSSGANSRRVTLELMRAEAHLAFGDSKAARRSLERALDADPELILDPDRTSPKVLSSFDRVRLHRQPSPDASESGR